MIKPQSALRSAKRASAKITLPSPLADVSVWRKKKLASLMVAHAGVRHEAVGLNSLVVMVTKMGVFDAGVSVLTCDRVYLGMVAALLAVELETAWYAFDL
jgi:hypothetical protein